MFNLAQKQKMIKFRKGKKDCLGKFYGIFQKSKIINPSPIQNGHTGGVVAFPVAVAFYNNKFYELEFNEIIEVLEVNDEY